MAKKKKTEKKEPWFPNPFDLNLDEMGNVARIIEGIETTDIEGSMAEVMTAQVVLMCTAFDMMHQEEGVGKADCMYVLQKIASGITEFINQM